RGAAQTRLDALVRAGQDPQRREETLRRAAQQAQTASTPPRPAGPEEFDDCGGAGWCPQMVVIPAGNFMMGSPPNESGRDSDEGPQRTVSIARFAVSKYEITRGQWSAFAAATNRSSAGGCHAGNGSSWAKNANVSWRAPGYAQDDRHPVTCV